MLRRALTALCVLAVATTGVTARVHTHSSLLQVGSVPAIAAPPAAETLFDENAPSDGALVLLDDSQVQVQAPHVNWVVYRQCGQAWSNDQLGTSSKTLCQAGCAMSSLAMLLRTRGVNVDPGTFNKWLRNHGGYVSGNLLVWGASNALGGPRMLNYYRGSGSMSQAEMRKQIGLGRGIIVNVNNGGHWVLVTGYIDGSSYRVNDPGQHYNSYPYQSMSNFVLYG